MNDRERHVAAVLADPEDDLPRLGYADWLDEHGDDADRLRAEFFRVQCRLARTRRAEAECSLIEGGRPGCCRWHDLRRREGELFAAGSAHQQEWATPAVHALMVAGKEWTDYLPWFRRGFVSSVTCTAEAWQEHADAILQAQPVEEVVLTTWPIVEGQEARQAMRELVPDLEDDWDARVVLDTPERAERYLREKWPRVKTWELPPAPLGMRPGEVVTLPPGALIRQVEL